MKRLACVALLAMVGVLLLPLGAQASHSGCVVVAPAGSFSGQPSAGSLTCTFTSQCSTPVSYLAITPNAWKISVNDVVVVDSANLSGTAAITGPVPGSTSGASVTLEVIAMDGAAAGYLSAGMTSGHTNADMIC